jgi:hypothetical protein
MFTSTKVAKNIIVKLGGFTTGMSTDEVSKRARSIIKFYTSISNRIIAFTWDGDPLKDRGSNLDEKRGTPACFTHALAIIHEAFPAIPFVAAKREDQLNQLADDYVNTTKHGSVEVGCESIFGPVRPVAHMNNAFMMTLSPSALNVLAAPAGIHWAELGCENIRFWKKMGCQVHYVTIGGGNVISEEIEKVGDIIDTLWRLETTRLSPKEDCPPDTVMFRFSTNDETLPIEMIKHGDTPLKTPKWCNQEKDTDSPTLYFTRRNRSRSDAPALYFTKSRSKNRTKRSGKKFA